MHRKLTTIKRIFQTGLINFVRNLSIAIAAIAVMVATLTILLLSVITNATFTNTINQVTSKIDISVYLKDSVTKEQTTELITEIKTLPNVKTVTYLDKEQVLQQYESQNSGNKQLKQAINETSNPLPATIHIKPVNLNQISDIKAFLVK